MAGKQFKMPGFSSLAFIAIFALAFRCERYEFPLYEDFIFVLKIRMVPSDSIIQKGDTLWILANFSDSIPEYYSNKKYLYQNPHFTTSFVLRRFISNQFYHTEQPGAINQFQLKSYEGFVHELSESYGSITFKYDNSRYICKIGLIPNYPGVFGFSFSYPSKLDLSAVKLEPTIEGRNRLPLYKGIYYVINEGATNFSLFQQHCKPTSLQNPISDNIYYEQKGTFTFRVVE